VSLILSGALTWALVSRLEYSTAQDQLAKNVLLLRPQVTALDCLVRGTGGRCAVPVSSEQAFTYNMGGLDTSSLAGARLILLDRPPRRLGVPIRQPHVIYDSAGRLTPGRVLPTLTERTIAGQRVGQGTIALGGDSYLVADAQLTNRYASYLVLARSASSVQAAASEQLIWRILVAGGAGLLLALLVGLLLARMFTKPLAELRAAAEDIAAGNYARRVRAGSRDEIGVVGQSFNRMAEAVERSRGSQRDFLANVSHELKTPLTSLIGFSQALMDGSLRTEAEKKRAATILNEESRRVLRMSQELLDLARVESGQMPFGPQPVDLHGQLEQEVEIVRQRAVERRLRLELAVPSWLPPVLADPERLHQILENLLDNAVKYAPEGTAVTISAAALPGGRLRTVVANEAGPHPPDPQRIFDRFYRGDPSRASSGSGVGLGLAISRELANAQDGSLTAALDEGGSLQMMLELPSAGPPPPSLEAPAPALPRGAPAPSPLPEPSAQA
jgi:signal transduction histidine kinase